MAYDRLSGLDTSFLHLETLETPMHVGALIVLEGEPFTDANGRFRLDAARTHIESRLHLIPRFRKRVVPVPLDAGHPIWVDDRDFDINRHVRLASLPAPGSRGQLLAVFEQVQAQVLDRARPLWELVFVEGLEDGHVALIQRTHHALIDGVSGIDVASVLLDFTPEPETVDAPAWRPAPEPRPARLLIDTVTGGAAAASMASRAVSNAAQVPGRAAARLVGLARRLAAVVDTATVAPTSSLNQPVGATRRFGTVSISLDDIKAVRSAFGGTVNDVVLAGVGGGLAQLLEARGELTPDLALQVFCPVSVRAEDDHLKLGNQLSAMFVPIPVGEPDPAQRLRSIQATTADLKEREQAIGAAALLRLTQFAAPTLLSLTARLAHRQPFFNLICTNIPGPQVPMYCMGARVFEAYPMVPLSKNLTIGIAVLSYCGAVHVGVLADRERVPDLEVLEAGIEDGFAELAKLARGRTDPTA
jgi:diacylglycerol O-acyltransferase / wax synthase